jgi:adenylate cyclase
MQRAEEATYAEFERLKRELIGPSLSRYEGRLIKTTGDGALVEFASPLAAVKCAVEIQNHLASGGSPLRLRVGLNLGDVIVGQDGELYGDGINIAVRLEGIADPGGVLISEKVYSEVEGKFDVGFEDRGEQRLKNISKPVRAYAVCTGAHSAPIGKLDAALPLPDKPSIAVLPFENMSGDPEQEYFADGMVEDIITDLSRSKSLFVIARHSTFTYKGKAFDIKQVGRELGVRYVLEGSVRKSGNRVRITGQLIDATTGTHLWADRFESQLEDIFDLQDQITSSVIGALFPQLERAEIERAKRKPTESLQAYDYYLRALSSFYEFTREQNIEALRLSQAANEIDPGFAAAYSLGAYSYLQRKIFGWTSDPAQERIEAQRLVRRAIEIDKDDPTVLARAGQVTSGLLNEVEDGLALVSRAQELDANLVIARYSSGWEHLCLGDLDAALKQFHIAVRLSPLDPLLFFAQTGIAFAHFMAGRYDDGSSWAKSAVLHRPNYRNAQFILAACHAMSGRVEEARVICARLMQGKPAFRLSTIIPKIKTRFRRAEDIERLAQACRIAGVPE